MESNEVFTDYQPQYPDLLGNINAVFKGVQHVSVTIRTLPDLTRQSPVAYSVIEAIVEGFVEGFADYHIGVMEYKPCGNNGY